MPEPSLRHLQYFTALARTNHFRRAGEQLGVSQPTITAQIAHLEDILGYSLFERSRSQVILTPKGRALLPHARALVTQYQDFLAQASGATTTKASMHRLGVPPTLGPYFLPDVIGHLHKKEPDLRLYVRESPPRLLQEGLVKGDYDLILSPLPLISKDLQYAVLFDEPLSLIVPSDHPFTERDFIDPGELAGEKILVLEERHYLANQVEHIANYMNAILLRDFEGTSLDTLRQMVATGMGLSFLPALYVRSEIARRHDVRAILITGFNECRTIALAWRPHSPQASFYRSLAAQIREICHQEFGNQLHIRKD